MASARSKYGVAVIGAGTAGMRVILMSAAGHRTTRRWGRWPSWASRSRLSG